MENKSLFLLDAYALIFRAYYAFISRPMINSKGLNTSAIFGFTITLDEILRNRKPSHIAVVFDTPVPTFRHEMYPLYKANREQTPEEIKLSIPYIKELIDAYKIPILEVPGYEADDIIGTIAHIAKDKGFTVFMMTPDKDYTQLVDDKIFIYKPKRSGNEVEILGVKEVCERFAIKLPEQVIDILALWGDASDNIPGAPGIGEKTAIQLISKYGNLQNVYENIDKLKGKQKETLINYQDQIELSKKLVTINIHVPIDFDEKSLIIEPIDSIKLKQLFTNLEFKTLEKRILGGSGPSDSSISNATLQSNAGTFTIPSSEAIQGNLFSTQANTLTIVSSNFQTITSVHHDYHVAEDTLDIKSLSEKLNESKEFCFDTETTGLNTLDATLVGISFALRPHEAWYIPIPEDQKKAKLLLEILRQPFENKQILKIGQNIKFDITMLRNYDLNVSGQLFDTMLAHYLIQPEERHSMDYLSEKYLGYRPVAIEELIGPKGKNQKNMRQVSLEIIKEYAAEDADVTLQLKIILEEELKKLNMTELFYSVEIPLLEVLIDMEYTGIKINTSVLQEYGKILKEEIVQTEEEIFKLTGERFNIGSPKQLGEVLFNQLKISDDAKKTKTKQFSTSEETLLAIKGKHPVIPLILDYRSCKKLLNTYIEVLPGLINRKTGRIHTSFNQTIVATGRLSSNNPNLQNIPVKEERGREIRKAFVPSGIDYVLLSADYSQIELRLMAHMSEDSAMIDAFIQNEDIHIATASKIYGVPIAEVSREMRSKAKTANFGIIYGISAFGLSQTLGIPRKESEELISGYFHSYPGVRKYMTESIIAAKEKGYVETILGRRRYLPEINSANSVIRGMAERNAINAPIQGSAADIIKIAMIKIFKRFMEEKFKSKMILQVHDELIFDVWKNELNQIKVLVKNEMENAYKLKVPIIAEVGYGNNWLEAH